MAELSLAEVASATGGALLGAPPDLRVSRYAIDSRAVAGGELFFALLGPRHDGHRFLADAYGRGAAAAVISEAASPGPAVRVADTTEALRRLGRHVRRRWGRTVVGITGSCGKTTTKDMLHRVLAVRHRVLATRGNLNNLYGLPLMLLELTDQHDAAVLEMGISTPGEMTPLADLAGPNVGVLLNVQAVHLVHFASVDDIARTKGALFEALGPDGIAVYNADDPRVAALAARHPGRRIAFGLQAVSGEAVGAEAIEDGGPERIAATVRCGTEEARLELPIGGRHNLMNALAALAAAHALGEPLARAVAALAGFVPASHRGERHTLAGGVVVWDESYNSNPAAMRAVLATLAAARPAGRRVLVAGDMLEIGPAEVEEHRALAAVIRQAGVDLFVGVGPLMRETHARLRDDGAAGATHCDDAAAAARVVPGLVRDGDLVLVKGSRGIGVDAVVAALIAARGGAAA